MFANTQKGYLHLKCVFKITFLGCVKIESAFMRMISNREMQVPLCNYN